MRTNKKFKKWNSQLLEQQLFYITKNIESRISPNGNVLFFTNTKENKKQTFFTAKIAQQLARNGTRVLYYQLQKPKGWGEDDYGEDVVKQGHNYKITSTIIRGVDDLHVFETELISSVFDQKLEEWVGHYDYIVLEAPEVLKDMYSQWIMSVSHAVVLFAKRKKTKKTDVRLSKELIERQQKRLLGIVYEQ